MDVLTKQKGVRKHRTYKEIFEAIERFGDFLGSLDPVLVKSLM